MSDAEGTGEGEGTGAEGEGAAATSAAPAPFSLFTDEGGINPVFAEHIGEDQKSVRSMIEKYKGTENPTKEFINGIANLNYNMGQKGFERPPEDAPDAVKADFVNRMRLLHKTPEKAEGYNYTKPDGMDENIPWNQEEATAYSDILHKHHASPELAADLFKLYGDSLSSVPAVVEAEERAHREATVEELRNEHGVNAEKVIKSAEDAGNLLGLSKEFVSHITVLAEGVNHLAQLKSMISGDLISAIKSEGSVNSGAGKSYEAQATEEGKKAFEAEARGDHAAMETHLSNQSRLNQLHANTSQ